MKLTCHYCKTFQEIPSKSRTYIDKMQSRFCPIAQAPTSADMIACDEIVSAKHFWCDEDNNWKDRTICNYCGSVCSQGEMIKELLPQ